MKKSFKFYIFFPSDLFANPAEIKTNFDLHIGDHLDFFDHQLCEELTDLYKTSMFIIKQREFSVEFNEMLLMVEPYIKI